MYFGRSPALSSFGHNIASLTHSSSFARDLSALTRSLIIHSGLRCAHPLAHDSVTTSLRSPVRMIRSRPRCARFSLIISSQPRFPGQLATSRLAAMNLLFFSPFCFFFYDRSWFREDPITFDRFRYIRWIRRAQSCRNRRCRR